MKSVIITSEDYIDLNYMETYPVTPNLNSLHFQGRTYIQVIVLTGLCPHNSINTPKNVSFIRELSVLCFIIKDLTFFSLLHNVSELELMLHVQSDRMFRLFTLFTQWVVSCLSTGK